MALLGWSGKKGKWNQGLIGRKGSFSLDGVATWTLAIIRENKQRVESGYSAIAEEDV